MQPSLCAHYATHKLFASNKKIKEEKEESPSENSAHKQLTVHVTADVPCFWASS
jgi:hypothetical protein